MSPQSFFLFFSVQRAELWQNQRFALNKYFITIFIIIIEYSQLLYSFRGDYHHYDLNILCSNKEQKKNLLFMDHVFCFCFCFVFCKQSSFWKKKSQQMENFISGSALLNNALVSLYTATSCPVVRDPVCWPFAYYLFVVFYTRKLSRCRNSFGLANQHDVLILSVRV